MRIAIGLEYDGRGFNGWATQPRGRAVQAAVEGALSRVANHPVRVVCAGRTDAGVHATGQVAHFDSEAVRGMDSWVMGGNANLPREISIMWAATVEEAFHARFSARARRYRYLVLNRRVRPALGSGRVAWEHRPLDVRRMQEAAQHLVGEHDFTSYRGAGCQARGAVRRIRTLGVSRHDERVVIDVTANAFLLHMVRNIAGVLIAIGAGKEEPGWARDVLDARDRRRGGMTAPPDGLYLTRVEYPEKFRLPCVVSPYPPLW